MYGLKLIYALYKFLSFMIRKIYMLKMCAKKRKIYKYFYKYVILINFTPNLVKKSMVRHFFY